MVKVVRYVPTTDRDRGVIEPSALHASGIRAALPGVKIAIDKWHLVALANTMVTQVRQRVTRSLLGRRGTVADPIWVNLRLLLTGVEQLSRYLDFMRRDTLLGAVHGIFAAQLIKPQARVLANDRAISCVTVDCDMLRGLDSSDDRLF